MFFSHFSPSIFILIDTQLKGNLSEKKGFIDWARIKLYNLFK